MNNGFFLTISRWFGYTDTAAINKRKSRLKYKNVTILKYKHLTIKYLRNTNV